MGLVRFITRGFIDFFGITEPSPEQERRAMWFICSTLLLIVVVAALVFLLMVKVIGR
jgi:heme/copper-type cytochrome/quinol oxidase subunit 2